MANQLYGYSQYSNYGGATSNLFSSRSVADPYLSTESSYPGSSRYLSSSTDPLALSLSLSSTNLSSSYSDRAMYYNTTADYSAAATSHLVSQASWPGVDIGAAASAADSLVPGTKRPSDAMSDGTPENLGDDLAEEVSVVVNDDVADSSAVNGESAGDDDNINCSFDSSLGRGLSSILSSVIRDFDSKAEDTLRSQDQLSFAIDRLTRELDQLLDDAPLPFIMQHAARISSVRKRVSSLNLLLKSMQRRVDNIDQTLSVGIHGKKTTDSAGQS